MKTAISVPDDVFARVEQEAARHALTAAIDEVVDAVNADGSTRFSVEGGAPAGRDGGRVVNRGDVHWCEFGHRVGSGPAKRRPVVVIQSDEYNRSRLATTVVVTLTSNTILAACRATSSIRQEPPDSPRTRSRT